jgi:hypothetical protein
MRRPLLLSLLAFTSLTLSACGDDSTYIAPANNDAPDASDNTDAPDADDSADAAPDDAAPDLSADLSPDLAPDDLASDLVADAAPDLPEDAAPCLPVAPTELDFGLTSVGADAQHAITIQSCSPTQPLRVTAVTLSGDPETFFSNDLPSSPLTLPPGEAATFTLHYNPVAEGEHTATVEIASDDPDHPLVRVNARGAAIANACPIAVARGRVQNTNTPTPFTNMIEAIPLQTIQLNADTSSDPDDDDAITRYAWSLIERPEGSNTTLDPSAANPALFLDLAGRYVVELTVYDRLGVPSCRPSRVTIDAVSPGDIYYELAWDTDMTDVDLHYLHPQGRWGASPWDCYYLNRTPDWGAPGDRGDDPSIAIDDTDGLGPEVLAHNNPEAVTYRLGALYFSDHNLGATQITARVFLRGVLAFERRSQPITDGQFWEAAALTWGADPSITPVDRVTDGFPPQP